jgi:hypothetical protein
MAACTHGFLAILRQSLFNHHPTPSCERQGLKMAMFQFKLASKDTVLSTVSLWENENLLHSYEKNKEKRQKSTAASGIIHPHNPLQFWHGQVPRK